jgi:hypothetical protein
MLDTAAQPEASLPSLTVTVTIGEPCAVHKNEGAAEAAFVSVPEVATH